MAAKTQTTYTMSTIPSWYTNYAQDILSNQQAVSGRPFTPYDASQRVAGFNPTQQQGFGMTQQAATGYQPMLDQAQTTMQGTLGRSALGAAQPMINQAVDTSALAPAYGALGQASQYTQASTAPTALNLAQPYVSASANPLGVSAASPYLQAAGNISQMGAAAPSMARSGNLAMQSTSPTGIAMAQPYLQQAGQSSVSNIGAYMNPYIENVVNRYGELGARTLQEQLMPSIMNKYITAGQLGGPTRPGTGTTGAPSGMMTDTARALRDVQESVGQQQRQALSEGYAQAAGLSQADLARQSQLAQMAGSLGFQQQGVLGQAAQQIGQLGAQAGQLAGQEQQNLANIGQTYGQLGTQQQQALAQAGQQMGQLGAQQQQALAGAGQQLGALGAQYAGIGQNQQQLMSTLAGQIASVYGQDTANQMAASGQLGQFAQQMQQQGLTGAQAVTGAGNQQQALEQAQRDANYQEFLRASGYDQAQIDAMTKTFGASAAGVPQGQVQLQTNKAPSNSMLGNLAGAALTLAGSTGRTGG